MTSFYFDTQRNLLIYPRSDVIEQYLPQAKAISPANGGRGLVAVPRTLQACQTLRWLNYPVPPVITDANYDWPIEPGKKALPHQKLMANFEVLHRKSFNLSDPGSMKTMPALWAADFLMRQYPPGEFRALIVAPLTILETVWQAAIFKSFLSHRSAEILHGSAGRRKALLAKKPDFGIINFDGVGVGAHTRNRIELDGFSAELANDDKIKMVIVDEADAYCDAQTKRHRIARLVFGNKPYLLLQTGTPTGQAPTDAFGMAKLVNNSFGKSFTTFRLETMVKVSNFKWVPKREGYDLARQLLTPAIRFRIEDVWQNAPPMTTQQRMVELTDEQKKHLASLKRDLQVSVKAGTLISAVNEGAARQKFLQIVMGAIYDADHKHHLIDAAPRMKEIEYLIERTPRKVLIFAGLTSIVEILHKNVSKRWKAEIINGNVPQKERARLIRAFGENDSAIKVMVMDPQPTAHGINEFVVADTVIWAGPTEKARLYQQGNQRAHRPGQKWPVTIYQLVATKLEQEIFRRLETNLSLQGAMLEAIRRGEL